ncbi:MAG: hypothetical protein AAGA66_05345 [Bacteroidota bacterium]
MRKLFAIATLITGTLLMVSCGDDDNAAPVVDTDITISGIPSSATLVVGRTLSVPEITVTSPVGLKSFKATIGSATIDLEPADFSEGATSLTTAVTATTADLGAVIGNNTITFTATNTSDETEVFIHTLVVEDLAFSVVDISDLDTNSDGDATAEVAKELSGRVNSDLTMDNDVTWVLAGRVIVDEGATLTIEAGTVIKARTGSAGNASALVVARGGVLNAAGTSTSPIVFTAISDQLTAANIVAGDVASPNLAPTLDGLWGGLIVLGNAPISVSSNLEETQIEGIPDNILEGRYGGSVADDNSGTIRYVSVRHGGTNIGEGNEINGITFGGVGSGTTVEWIEVVGNQDDGIEWFGGTVNVSNAVVWNAGDDAIDTDQAWSGTLDNAAVVASADTDHAFELDGPEGDATGSHTITNVTAKGFISVVSGTEEGGTELADLRSNLAVSFNNAFFFNFPDPNKPFKPGTEDESPRGDFSTGGCADCTLANLQGVLPVGATLEQVFKGESTAAATAVTTGTVGATVTGFDNWSWTFEAGSLADF